MQNDVVEAAYEKFLNRLEPGFAGCDMKFIFLEGYQAALTAQHSDLADELEESITVHEGHGKDWCEIKISGAKAILTALRSNRAAIVEECAKVCERQRDVFLSPEYATNQPISSIGERFACAQCALAIRSLNGGDHD